MEPSPTPNPQPAAPTAPVPDLRSLEPAVRRELRRHFLSERERLVADQVVEITLGHGLNRVRIPKLEVLSDLTGMDRSHVHGALKSLHEMRIVTTGFKEGSIVLTVNLDSETWKVKPRIPKATTLRGLEVVREYNHIPAADGGSLNFRVFDPAQFLLPLVADSATVADFPQTL